MPVELRMAAAYAGPPSVAHAEALLRAVEARSVALDGKLDAICIGIAPSSAHLPRESPNPLLAAYLALGIVLQLWRDDFPVVDGGHRRSSSTTSTGASPARSGPTARSSARRGRAEREARALADYRAGRSAHPLLPETDWEACQPALERLGAVIVAGCRDAAAARMLGFIPAHGVSAALDMARGRAGRDPRIGFILSPPYFPIRVSPVPGTLEGG